MNPPDIHAETQIHDDAVVFRVNQTTLNGQSLFALPDFIHPHEVEEKVNAFNDVSKDLILEHHYARDDKSTLTVQVLFKPLFTKLGESQKYAYFRIVREGDRAFHCERVTGKPLGINVPAGVDPIPVHTIRVTQVDVDSAPYLEVHVRLLADTTAYKNLNVVVGFVKKLSQSLYEHVVSESTAPVL